MKQEKGLYRKLFLSTFYLSTFTFGGGYVIVPLMKKKFVDEMKWIDEEEMLNLVAIAQSAPGAIAVNASILSGYKVAGFPGAFLTILGTISPPLIILSVISLFYQSFRSNQVVAAVLGGMQVGVAAVIVDVVITMVNDIVKLKKLLPFLVMVGVFVGAYFFHIHVAYLLIFSGVFGALAFPVQEKEKVDKP